MSEFVAAIKETDGPMSGIFGYMDEEVCSPIS